MIIILRNLFIIIIIILINIIILQIRNTNKIKYTMNLSMLEIYNEEIRDLLKDKGKLNQKLEIRHSNNENLIIPELTTESVDCRDSIMKLFDRGNGNRSVASTNIHEYSSRSHSVVILDVAGIDESGDGLSTSNKF